MRRRIRRVTLASRAAPGTVRSVMGPTRERSRSPRQLLRLGRHGTRWIGVDGKGATARQRWLPRLRQHCPGRWSSTSMTSHGPTFAAGSEIGSCARYCGRCWLGNPVGISGGTSIATSAQSGAPFPSACPSSSRGYRRPTYGSVFRGTSPSGSRCPTSSGWHESSSGTVQR